MLKPFPFLAATVLFAIAPMPTLGRMPGQAAPPSTATNPVKPTPQSQAKAKKLYAVDCAMCHGDNGDGKTDLATSMQLTQSDWTDPKSLASKPDQELFNVIRNGKDKMPPEEENRAKDVDVWNLILYIRSFSKGQPAPATASN